MAERLLKNLDRPLPVARGPRRGDLLAGYSALLGASALIDPAGLRDTLLSNVNWAVDSKRLTNVCNVATGMSGTNKDFHLIGTTELPFDAVRLIVLSAETAGAASCTAAIAPTANMTTVNTPTGSWTGFTWSGSSSFTMPSSSNAAQFGALASDWMQVQSVARNDGGIVPMFMLRIHIPVGAGNTYTADASTNFSFDTDQLTAGRRWFRMFQSNIDSVTTPSAFTNTSESSTFPACILQFRIRGKVMSVAFCGDSIAGGSTTTGGVMSCGYLTAQALTSSAFPVDYVSGGWSGQTTTNYLANAKTLITASQPHVAFYNVYSPNDSSFNQTVANAQVQRAMDFVSHARANNCLPVLVTATPLSTDSSAASAIKVSQTAQVNALADQGFLIADVYSATADFVTPNGSGGWGWKSGYSTDGTHPNDVGAAAIRDAVYLPLLTLIRDRNF